MEITRRSSSRASANRPSRSAWRTRSSNSITVGVDMVSSLVPGVPDLDRLIEAGRGDAASVGAERHAINVIGVSFERELLLARHGVPDLDRLIPTGRCDATSVGTERHATNATGVSLERERHL